MSIELPVILKLPPAERLQQLAGLVKIYGIRLKKLVENIPTEKRVQVWIVPPGRIEYREYLDDQIAPFVPSNFPVDILIDKAKKGRVEVK